MEYFISDWEVIPSSGGIFEVSVNDELIFSKKSLGRHAEPGEVKSLLQAKIDAFKTERGITWDNLPED
jgi:selenoprotein W-related protein